ncbi:MAG: YigZ family protein [Lachnospiraceae bacterium]|nr:YigZ family protein [Lachnospiraceae bacterium]
MKNTYNILYSGGSGRIEEKKSVFIADVRPVHNDDEISAFMDETKKKYWDASHHCYAYVLSGEPAPKKFSDAGEPSGTAGKPILDVIEGNGLHDIMIIVTRYFGGTLLGTGGLVRAYQAAAREGIADSVITERHDGILLRYTIDYDLYGKLRKMSENEPMYLLDPEFTDRINLNIAVDKSDSENIIDKVEELSAAKAELTDKQDISFIYINGKVEIL